MHLQMGKILVTGGAGFIGRYVCRDLLEHGHQVRIIDAFVDQVHFGGITPAEPGVEVVRADIRDPAAVRQALDGVDGVIHLAAEVGVGQSMYEIARYVGANDLGTATLLEAAIGLPLKRLVVASSMSVYGEGLYQNEVGERIADGRRDHHAAKTCDWEPRDDHDRPLSPISTDESKPVDLASIYALTKYSQERQALIFGEAYGIDVVALRLFNVFGPGQALSNPYTGVLANFASRLANGERPIVFEDGEQQRDFVHVTDVAAAFRLALTRPDVAGQVINVGSGHAYRITDVATLLAAEMGRPDLDPNILYKARAGDIRNCFADITKAREVLGYEPKRLLEDSLGDFTNWVRQAVVIDNAAEMQRQLEMRGLVS